MKISVWLAVFACAFVLAWGTPGRSRPITKRSQPSSGPSSTVASPRSAMKTMTSGSSRSTSSTPPTATTSRCGCATAGRSQRPARFWRSSRPPAKWASIPAITASRKSKSGSTPTTPRELAELELLLSRAFIDFGRDINRGRDPAEQRQLRKRHRGEGNRAADTDRRRRERPTASPNMSRRSTRRRANISAQAGAGRVSEIAAEGGWPTIPKGPALKPGKHRRARSDAPDKAADNWRSCRRRQ